MKTLKLGLVFFFVLASFALGQQKKNKQVIRGTGTPSAGSCSGIAAVSDEYINTAAGGLVYTCTRTGANAFAWSQVGAVPSVFGRAGAVVATTGDYTASQVTNAADTTMTYSNPAFIASLAGAKITGLVSAANLGTGTANSTTCLYGDQTYKACGGTYTAGTGVQLVANEFSINSAVTQTRVNDQAGTNLSCTSSTGSAAYTCALNPSLTTYTDGMVVRLKPNFANATTATLAIDGLGALSILTRNGSALSAGDIPSGRITLLGYNGTSWNIIGDGGGSSTPTLADVWAPYGFPTGSEIAFNPGATVVKAYSFTPNFNMSFTKVAFTGNGTGYVAFAIYTFAGSAQVTNGTMRCLSAGSGNGSVCSFPGAVTLTAGTTYRLALSADAATGWYVSNGGNLAYNSGSGSGFPFSSTVAIGTAANASTGSGVSLAMPATTGTISAVTGSISHNSYPALVFIP